VFECIADLFSTGSFTSATWQRRRRMQS